LEQEIAYITCNEDKDKKKQHNKVIATLKMFDKVYKIKEKAEATWNLKEIQTMLGYKKIKGDGKLPQTLPEAMAEWHVRKTRASPVKPVRPPMQDEEESTLAVLLAAAVASEDTVDADNEVAMINSAAV
jgi:hypothetical protein